MFAKKLPILGMAISNAIFINYTGDTSTLIISIILFMTGYIISKIIDIFGLCDDGILFSDSLKIVGAIILLCAYSITLTVTLIGQIAFFPLAVLDIISGYFASFLQYEDEYYDDDNDIQ